MIYNNNKQFIKAPVKKGEVIGKLILNIDNTSKEIELTVAEDVAKANIFELYLKNLKGLFGN